MIQPNEPAPDPFDERDDPAITHAVADLEAAYAAAPSQRLGAEIDRVVYARMAVQPASRLSEKVWRTGTPRAVTGSAGFQPAPAHDRGPARCPSSQSDLVQTVPARLRRTRTARLRLVSFTAALLLALSGLAGYLRLNTPTPASADVQRIVRRATAALRLAPDQAAHYSYSVTVNTAGLSGGSDKASGGLTGTADVWVETGTNGAPALLAQTLTMNKAAMNSRFIQANGQTYAYNPEMRGDDSIMIDLEARVHPSWLAPNEMLDGADVARELSTLAAQAPQKVHLLPQQQIDGHTADVILVDGWTNRPAQRTTFYVDAESYALLGFDAISHDPSYQMPAWQVRLDSYTTMAAASVPPHTFTLNASATAQVARLDLADPATFASLQTSFTTACRATGLVNLKMLLRSGQTLLTACQGTAPDMTQADLVAVLAAPSKAAMDAAVAAGQITPTQEANSLPALQEQLTTLVTTPATGLSNPAPTPGTDAKPGA